MLEYPSDFYSIAKITWLKINARRMAFYDGILAYSQKSTTISDKALYEIGSKAGLDYGLVDDEVILCRYANFLIPGAQESQYFITKNARSDFLIYQKEARFKQNEIPLTIDFSEKYTKITINITDTIPSALISELKSVFFFGLNYSLNRLSKNFISHAKLLAFLNELTKYLVQQDDILSSEGIIETYGNAKSRYSEKVCQINHRGWYYSESLIKFKDIYFDLLKIAVRPIDWCGKNFSYSEVDEIAKIHGIDAAEFLKIAMADNMIRSCEDKSGNYTITGQAHTVINALLEQEEKSRLLAIMRPSNVSDSFDLWIGDNSLYHKDFYHAFTDSNYEYDSGWYVIKELDQHSLIWQLDRFFSFFKLDSGLGVQKLPERIRPVAKSKKKRKSVNTNTMLF